MLAAHEEAEQPAAEENTDWRNAGSIRDYLDAIGEQIENPHARCAIRREIGNHIEEQTEDYHREGMTPPGSRTGSGTPDGGSAADRQGIEPDPQAEVSDSVVWHHGDTDTGGNCHAGNLVFPYGDGGSGKLSA
ncbi:MAG: hypothetical protein ACLVGL_01045 [Waltera sp.]